ncbi:ankyrin repeat domain-containing protein [archaeon]|nr:MAG: ankyrin repeat domain-containing protein [archaeon]
MSDRSEPQPNGLSPSTLRLLNGRSRSFTKIAAENSDSYSTDPQVNSLGRSFPQPGIDIDWYGNTTLHHAFATNNVNLIQVKLILSEFPSFASYRNQFGRIPLHYALDRIKVCVPALRTLLKYYPEGLTVADVDNMTPYDLAVKWKHSNAIMLLLLKRAPSLDMDKYLRLKYGPLANIAIWANHAMHYHSEGHSAYEVGGDESDGHHEGRKDFLLFA